MFRSNDLFLCFSSFFKLFFVLPFSILYSIVKTKTVGGNYVVNNRLKVGFFHPYCNDGGGGERVLWAAVKAIQRKYPESDITVYTGDTKYSPTDIIEKVEQRFNIQLTRNIQFVYLFNRHWVEANKFPFFTLLGQSLGSVWLGLEAFNAYLPDIYIDTMGYAFTYPLFKYIGNCQVLSYTHYPTITTEMMKKVWSREQAHNNNSTIVRSSVLSYGKLWYYKLFAIFYGFVGRSADIVMVNSTWTSDHIKSLWNPSNLNCLYPPCDVRDLEKIKRTGVLENGVVKIISVGQFRPEKNHALQVCALQKLNRMVTKEQWSKIMLVFIGACRNEEDRKRVTSLQELCKKLNVEQNVQFKTNISYEELKTELSQGTIGIHTMWNEHFGIGVVECMAAGLLTVSHCSGGPKADIIEHKKTGFLAETAEQYAESMLTIINMSPEDRMEVIKCARSSIVRFSSEQFERKFLNIIKPYFDTEITRA